MIRVDGPRFRDEQGRTLILRGANLGGSSKVPSRPPLPTRVHQGFYDHRDISFMGRPFPVEEADEHFRRLRDGGMFFNRFVVTWEAVEHRGPGEYDREYLDYLEAVLARGAAHGLRFVVDFHQDVWSRFTGGDGAPGWTLELAGLNPRTLHATGAAVLHCERGGRLPNLLWPTNNWKLGAATMATLFFGGNVFAPELRLERMPAQAFLQDRYAGFVREVVRRVAAIDAVVGFDLMNEPPAGFIGYPDLASDRFMFVRGDATPTPFDGMAAGSGFPRKVPVYRMSLLGVRRIDRRTVNPEALSAWLPGAGCPWLRHGVWTDRGGKPELLRPGYFAVVDGRRVSFGRDFLKPFLVRLGREVHAIRPDSLLCIEDSPRQQGLRWSAVDGANAIHAAHWYDSLTMFRKRFSPWVCVDERTLRPAFGRAGVRRSFRRQISTLAGTSARDLGGIPTFVGEFGLPFDLDDGNHVRALEAYYDALDYNFLGAAIWNYTADNTNESGDGWNDENFSVFSRDHRADDGGRAVDGFCRPYAIRIAGTPVLMRCETGRHRFTLAFRHDPAVQATTEVFVPARLARSGLSVRVSDGSWRHDAETQTLFYSHDPGRPEHTVVIEWPAQRRPVAPP